MKTELWDAKETVMGRTVGRHRISIPQVPDAIISKEKKKELHLQWVVEPERNKNEAQLREAQARYHGGWEEGSGLVISNFDPKQSDIDFLVEFSEVHPLGAFERYFGLREALERLFHRSVDLIEERAIRNPYFREAIERDRVLLYGTGR